MNSVEYQEPVAKLLTFGACDWFDQWPNYATLGLKREHVPELIRMALDSSLDNGTEGELAVWASTHAWRALAQLRDDRAVKPLIELVKRDCDDDWIQEELPSVFRWIGKAAVGPLSEILGDATQPLNVRTVACTALEEIPDRHRKLWPECVAALTAQMERFRENDPRLNAWLLHSLENLNAEIADELVEEAVSGGFVDESTAEGREPWDDEQYLHSLTLRLAALTQFRPLYTGRKRS